MAEAAHKLVELPTNCSDVDKKVKEIEFIEHRGDQLTHTLMQRLNKTFFTPFDREGMHALGSGLDHILDLIDNVASRMVA